MLSPTSRLRQFELEYQRTAWQDWGIREALACFEAMLHHARQVRPDLGSDWREDLAADLAIARAVNGLPPA
jgi:alkylhydroperoxidase family enzyme